MKCEEFQLLTFPATSSPRQLRWRSRSIVVSNPTRNQSLPYDALDRDEGRQRRWIEVAAVHRELQIAAAVPGVRGDPPARGRDAIAAFGVRAAGIGRDARRRCLAAGRAA